VLYRLAMFFTIFGDFRVPNGERHFAVVLSRVKEEAGKAIGIVDFWLTALGVAHNKVGDVIEVGANRGIRIVSASVAGATGWRSYFIGKDERSKWPEGGSEEFDAGEIDTSAAAMCATHEFAPMLAFGSAWGDVGLFHDTITGGSDERKIVLGPTPTWIAAPHISEESTHRREGNIRRWKREFAAIFASQFDGNFFRDEDVEAATDHGRPPVHSGSRDGNNVICLDPGFSGDRFGIAIGHPEHRGTSPIVVVDYVEALSPPRGGTISPEATAWHVAKLKKRFPGEGNVVRSDQYSAVALKEIYARYGLTLVVEGWNAPNKVERFELLRVLLADRRVRLPDCPDLRHELAGIGVKLATGGHEIISSRAKHDDRASALVHCVSVAHKQAPTWGRSEQGGSFYDYERPKRRAASDFGGGRGSGDGSGGAFPGL
jgi:hypothetical protein